MPGNQHNTTAAIPRIKHTGLRLTLMGVARIIPGLGWAAVSRPVMAYKYRGIAQPGSAPALGAGCREFESLYPDQF